MTAAPLLALTLAALCLMGGGAVGAVVPDGGFVVQGSTADIKRQIDIAHQAGAPWVSVGTNWGALEPEQGLYPAAAWDPLAERLRYAKSKGLSTEIRIVNAPQWASGRAGADDPPTPAHLPGYQAFLTHLGQTLGDSIDAYSPWNEPNRPAFWSPTDPDAFTALQKAAYPAIKAGDPTAIVVYGPVVGRYASQNSGYTFLRRSYALGARGSFDVIGWNGYPGGPPESAGPVEGGVPAANTLAAQQYLRGIIDPVDPGRRVWLLELSWSTCSPCNVSGANGASEAAQADYLRRTFAYRRAHLPYVERIFWYALRDSGTNRGAWDQNQGIIRNDWSAKPALGAFAALGVDPLDPFPPGPLTPVTPVPAAPVTAALPPAAAKLALPAASRSASGAATVIGRPRITRVKGVFSLAVRISVAGGAARLRVDGYRARRWRLLTTVGIPRSGKVTLRFRDAGFSGFRLRATLPGGTVFRAGRVARVPARYLRAS